MPIDSVHYHADDDSYTFSDLNQRGYVKATATGEVVWRLGGPYGVLSGAPLDWIYQHGHHLIDDTHLLIYANDGVPGAASDGASAVEFELDLVEMTASVVFGYSTGFGQSPIYGDAQRLPNGNTLLTITHFGIQEVDATGELLQEFQFDTTVGYTNHRPTLYGPPPPPRAELAGSQERVNLGR